MSDKDIEQQIQSKGLTAPRITLDDFKANIVNTRSLNTYPFQVKFSAGPS